jgi:hypothetical protein
MRIRFQPSPESIENSGAAPPISRRVHLSLSLHHHLYLSSFPFFSSLNSLWSRLLPGHTHSVPSDVQGDNANLPRHSVDSRERQQPGHSYTRKQPLTTIYTPRDARAVHDSRWLISSLSKKTRSLVNRQHFSHLSLTLALLVARL